MILAANRLWPGFANGLVPAYQSLAAAPARESALSSKRLAELT